MKLTILGSGTLVPNKKRNESGYLLEVDKKSILLDAGSGIKSQLARVDFDIRKLSHIFITHTHVDHVSDIPDIIWALLHYYKKIKGELDIIGPPKFTSFYHKLINLLIPGIKNIPSMKNITLSVKDVKNDNFKIGKISVKTKLMSDRQGITFSPYEVGYRITCKNKSLVYCGDNTEKSWPDIVALAKNCDLLILEAAKVKLGHNHLDPVTAGKIAQEANVKKLVLTHFYPEVEKVDIKKLAGKYYKGPIVLARDLMEIKI